MKMFLRLLFLTILALCTSANASDPKKARPLQEWEDLVKKDAKLSALIEVLGKPDFRMSNTYYWRTAVEAGMTELEALMVDVSETHGTPIVNRIKSTGVRTWLAFPWTIFP